MISQGRLVEAKKVIRLSIEDRSSEWGEGKFEIALLLFYKGAVSYLLGDLLDAERASQEALRRLAQLETSNPELELLVLNQIAAHYLEAKKYDRAHDALARAQQVATTLDREDNPLVGITFLNFGTHAFWTQRTAEARLSLRRAIGILSGKDQYQRQLLTALNNLYLLEVAEGKLADAESLLSLIQSQAPHQAGMADLELATLYYNAAAFYYYLRKDHSLVLSYTRSGLAAQRRFLMSQLPRLAIRRRWEFFDSVRKRGEAAEWLYWWTEAFPGATSLALETSLNTKGIIQDLFREQLLLLAGNSKVKKLTERINALTADYASLNAPVSDRGGLYGRIEQLEEELYEQLSVPPVSEVTVDAISSVIPADGVLIEFQKYRRFLGDFTTDGQNWGESHYVAFILKPNQAVTVIQLGASAPIESAIHRALHASANDLVDSQALWSRVSDLVIKPLVPALAGSNQWFLSPEAELNRVPFAALPSPQNPAKALGQAVHVRLFTSGRDLLRLQKPVKPAKSPVVMANPSFDRGAQGSSAYELNSEAGFALSRSSDLGTKAWAPLPASEREGQKIGTLLATRPITDAAATSSRLQQLNAPRVLHIATHGFFLSDVEIKPNDPLLAVQEQSALLLPFRGEDPQLRSGLVLAGANQPDADPNDDGYLTAAEAVGLKLDGTELVVLSACSTGQGDIRTGEGVYGLQRALTVAGARSTLLSLWKVDDAATAEFMVRFYKRLKAGEGRADALAAVQAEFRDGAVQGQRGEDWSNPYFWAAWQLVGDWRPIPGL